MINHIEHIGIAVKNIEHANRIYEHLLGNAPYKEEWVETEQVKTSFFKQGNNKVELLEAASPESAIAKFIEKRGEGIHHIAFDVDDIREEMARLKGLGFQLIHENPRRGADNKWVCFIHPKTTNGVLIELCQQIKSDECL